MGVDIANLIHRGGVYADVDCSTPEEIYRKISDIIPLPEYMPADTVCKALCAREKIMSTAVGNGIALPHARAPVVKKEEDQRICVVYLKTPLDMHAPDERKVFVMFILLTQNSQTHLQVLSALVNLFKKVQFRKLLEAHASEVEILNVIRELS